MRVHFHTNQYEFAHGKKPRGQGTWWFTATYLTGDGRSMEDEPFSIPFSTFTEAKREANAKVRADAPGRANEVDVEVMS